MHDFLVEVADEVKDLLEKGYYSRNLLVAQSKTRRSLRKAIDAKRGYAVIAELKLSSPSKGRLAESVKIGSYVSSVEDAGVAGFSVLTQPKHFDGSLHNLTEVRKTTTLPVLMKDFVISRRQLDAAHRAGADAVLLIQGIFDSNLAEESLDSLIDYAHSLSLEVLTEVNNEDELVQAVRTESDMIGVNRRNLRTLEMSIEPTEKLLAHPTLAHEVVVAESGIMGPEDARRCFELGADAILVGSYLMQAENVTQAARLLVRANG